MPFASFIITDIYQNLEGWINPSFRFGSPFQDPGANILSKLIFCVLFAVICGNNVANSPAIGNYSLKGTMAIVMEILAKDITVRNPLSIIMNTLCFITIESALNRISLID